MRILVLGGAGMLGHKVFQTLSPRDDEVLCTVRGPAAASPLARTTLYDPARTIDEVDCLDLPAVRALLDELRPDHVVNCVGIIKQRGDAKAAIPSITINSLLPHLLAEQLDGWGGRLIHFSTDCVFRGDRGGYTEDDPSDATDLYGRSKHLGEVATDNALTIRSSIIGRELSHFASLLEWFLAQGQGPIRGFTKAIWSGVPTTWMAWLVGHLIDEHPTLSGMYQLAAEPLNKYDLLRMLAVAYGRDIDIVPDDAFAIDRSLDGSRFLEATGIEVPQWPELIGGLVADPTPYADWR